MIPMFLGMSIVIYVGSLQESNTQIGLGQIIDTKKSMPSGSRCKPNKILIIISLYN